jgi:hypothetical protein
MMPSGSAGKAEERAVRRLKEEIDSRRDLGGGVPR